MKNEIEYFKSLSEELDCQANRVRNLIGRNHWLSDGHHKEYLLTSMLKKYLPDSLRIGRGFVIDSRSDRCSSEQDVLIVDSYSQAPLFFQDGTIITLPFLVMGVVSVKTTFESSSFIDAVEGLLKMAQITNSNTNPPWLSVYFYDDEQRAQIDCLKKMKSYIKKIKFVGKYNIMVRVSNVHYFEIILDDTIQVTGWETDNVATAIFLANLISDISSRRDGSMSSLAELISTFEGYVVKNNSVKFTKDSKT